MTRPTLRFLACALLAVGSLACAAAAAGPSVAGAAPREDVRPNVLLVNLDDARFDAYTVMPLTQAWMAAGTTYPTTIVDIPSCCPSRASTFTGRFPHNNGLMLQDDPDLDTEHTMQHYLLAAGYRTAMAGKYLVSADLGQAPADFERFSFIKGGYYDFQLNHDGAISTKHGYSTTVLGKHLRGFLRDFADDDDDQPWFAMYTPQAPHVTGGWKGLAVPSKKYADAAVPECVQPGETDTSDKPPYVRTLGYDPDYLADLCASQQRTLLSVDDQLDDTMAFLERTDELQNTLVIVTSDNGNHWGEQNWVSKFLPYEASIRVPLQLRWPDRLLAGVDDRLVSSLDVTATVLEAAGIVPEIPLDGDSLLQPPAHGTVFAEYFADPANGTMPTWAAVRGPGWIYIENDVVGAGGAVTRYPEYYDLVADPQQDVNVLGDDSAVNDLTPERLTELAGLVEAGRTCAGVTCP